MLFLFTQNNSDSYYFYRIIITVVGIPNTYACGDKVTMLKYKRRKKWQRKRTLWILLYKRMKGE